MFISILMQILDVFQLSAAAAVAMEADEAKELITKTILSEVIFR